MYLPHSIQRELSKTHLILRKTFRRPPSLPRESLSSWAWHVGSALIWPLPAVDLIVQCSPLFPFCFRRRKHRLILSTLYFFILSAITHNAYSASNALQPSLRQTAKGYSSRSSWKSLFSATFPKPQVKLFSPFFVTHVIPCRAFPPYFSAHMCS